MTTEELHTALNETLKARHAAREAAHAAREALVEAQRNLKLAEMHAVNAGLTGSNAEARKAELASITEAERQDVHDAETRLLVAGFDLETAELNHRHARAVMQLYTRRNIVEGAADAD